MFSLPHDISQNLYKHRYWFLQLYPQAYLQYVQINPPSAHRDAKTSKRIKRNIKKNEKLKIKVIISLKQYIYEIKIITK